MSEPVSAAASQYYGYWTPWLIGACGVVLAVVVLLARVVHVLTEIRDLLASR